MATFCIPPILAEQLKAAAKRGEIDIEKMYDMTSVERNALFANYVDKETAKKINTRFEKAMVSQKATALADWATEVFKGSEEKVKAKKDILDRISELQEQGLLTPQQETDFYQDLVSEKLGLTVTQEEAEFIDKLAREMQIASEKESEFGTPTEEYFKLRRKMQDYIDSLSPSNQLKVLSSVIGRGNMLARVSSPFLNIESNTVMAALQAFSRRLENRTVGGVNNEYAKKYLKFAVRVYQQSGYDVTRMVSLQDDLQVRGEDILTSQGKGKVRKVARYYEDVIFKTMQGLPDVVFAGMSAADRANIESTKMARAEGLTGAEAQERALELFKDSTRIDPKTKEGRQIREAAITDATYSTYTNKSVYADVSLGIRKVLNIASGDLRVGDQIMPFVKTPANVIGTGLNMSGVGLPIDATWRMVKVIDAIKKGDQPREAMKEQFTGFGRSVTQAGLGWVFSLILSSLFEPDDFIGEYPVSEKERQLMALENGITNSVKIGNMWVSLDYFGTLGSTMTGMLYAKKYGTGLPEQSYQYFKGVLAQSSKLPGLENIAGVFDYLDGLNDGGKKTISEEVKDVMNYAIGFGQSRLIPGIVYDLSKMTDSVERRTSGNEDMFARLKSAFPGFRQTLPEKKTVYGEAVKTENPLVTLLFGSRVKTARDSELITELNRLEKAGNLPSITDVSKTSPRAKELKSQIGNEKFEEFMTDLGKDVAEKSSKEIKKGSYQRASEEDKKKRLDGIKSDSFEYMLKKYKYKRPRK